MVHHWWPLVECRIAVSSAITCFPPWIALQQPTNTNINTIRMAPMLLLFVLIQKQLQHRCFFWLYLFFHQWSHLNSPQIQRQMKWHHQHFYWSQVHHCLALISLSWIVKIGTQIYLSCYLDLSTLLNGFVKAVTWICQSCSTYFSLAAQNQVEVWPRFQSLLKMSQSTQCLRSIVPLAMCGKSTVSYQGVQIKGPIYKYKTKIE